jgi:uncharacterized protein (TIGR02145 family)
VLSVVFKDEIRSVKILNSSDGGQLQSSLVYDGITEAASPLKSQNSINDFNFSLGDQLQFTAYATGYLASIIIDIPESNKTYVFEMVPTAFICGNFITINHVTGEVAPVDKTVTYSTVTNIPGEPSKCWITSNLGADHQAAAVSDDTELSAGWYWQFNLKQGYKHDGTTRTPNTVWINYINENSDWIAANDPCAIELGSGWRIPTSTEWTNVDANGNWVDWNGPWNSGLKLHASGVLVEGGSLVYRGSDGAYRSMTQTSPSMAWFLSFYSGSCYVGDTGKIYGFSLRCIRGETVSAIPSVNTTTITNITHTTATGGGDVTDDGGAEVTARGVCWSTSQNPTIADSHTSDGTGTGIFVSNLSGITPNTQYFVKAYATNSVGTAYGNEETFTTLSAGFVCGSPLTINHVTGEVVPVDKTVTYGTVTNIPGEPSKCWITSNLGADQQAAARDDATEASAGWYWQFNRKQGYKHDGTTRTPNTAWITNINENSDWIPTNDPCALELGVDWRIPTSTEWQNVDANGNWADWNGPWNSGLKLHAAGLLGSNDGLLYDRGSSCLYWSNNQYSTTDGSSIYFSNGFCSMFSFQKSGGFSLRCIKDIFTCGDVVNYEGQNYNTVKIGTQCWFKENLNVGTMIDGIESQTDNSVIEKFCFDNMESNCSVYGGLYQWDEMMQYSTAGGAQGICPAGWHLPTDAELITLTTCVSSKTANRCNSNVDYIAKSMAATTNWNTSTNTCAIGNNLAANNATGFTGLSSGYRDTDGAFLGIGSYGYFWSSNQVSSTDAWSRGLDYYNAYVRYYYGPKGYGFSVRCVRD